jgi:tetratricopeptide (TPR) repeat protein
MEVDFKTHVMLCVLMASICIMSGCGKKKPQNVNVGRPDISTSEEISDKKLKAYQDNLLETASEIANNISTVNTFLKTRSRIQQDLVECCLELDQPIRSVKYADNIINWRRGLCYAKTAYYLAGKGYKGQKVLQGLELAEKVAGMDHGQKWRSDRIKAMIAHTYIALGEYEKAETFSKDLIVSERIQDVALVKLIKDDETFKAHVEILDAQVKQQDFDLTLNALNGFAELYDAFYSNFERRQLAEDKIKASWIQHPVNIRIDLLIKLFESSVAHSDTEKGLVLVGEIKEIVDGFTWLPAQSIVYSVKLSRLYYACGQKKLARQYADDALVFYKNNDEEIPNVDRTDVLCPIAEIYKLFGETQIALSVYKQAVKVSFDNPNPIPQSENLSLICRSMVLSSTEPNSELLQKIQSEKDELAQRWKAIDIEYN